MIKSRHAESTPGIQNSPIPGYMASYDTLEKNYHSKFCRETSVKRKGLATNAVIIVSIAPCCVCPQFNATYSLKQATYKEFENLID